MDRKTLENYAKVLVEYSTNVQKGDLVIIRLESPEAQPLGKELYKQKSKPGDPKDNVP